MTSYTPQDDDTLRTLFAQGLSYSQIGKALGRTKNSAISRARRLGLPQRSPDHIAALAVRSARIRHKAKPQPRRKKMEMLPVVVPYLPIPDESKLASIIDATGCKWPVRDDPEFIGGIACCNHDAAPGAPYCAYHAAKSRNKHQPKPIVSLGPIGLRFQKAAA